MKVSVFIHLCKFLVNGVCKVMVNAGWSVREILVLGTCCALARALEASGTLTGSSADLLHAYACNRKQSES